MELIVDVPAFKNMVALAVNRVTLLLHHVVVLEHVLAYLEVMRLNFLLGFFDGGGYPFMLDRNIVGKGPLRI